jgi:hypothetical protein
LNQYSRAPESFQRYVDGRGQPLGCEAADVITATVVVAAAVVELLTLVTPCVVCAFVVVGLPPEHGRHWEYQGLEYVQQEPEIHELVPVQPVPPPVEC